MTLFTRTLLAAAIVSGTILTNATGVQAGFGGSRHSHGHSHGQHHYRPRVHHVPRPVYHPPAPHCGSAPVSLRPLAQPIAQPIARPVGPAAPQPIASAQPTSPVAASPALGQSAQPQGAPTSPATATLGQTQPGTTPSASSAQLTAEAVPQLVDFNISFCSKLDGATPAAYFGGSLAYMAPEQLEACDPTHPRSPDSLTGASDVYSLGVVLWELLTGSRPFADQQLSGSWSETLALMVDCRRRGPALDSNATPTGSLRELMPVLLKCLQADPEQRYASSAQLVSDLRLCLQPAARQLLRTDPDGWVVKMRRLAVLVLAAAALGPNVPTAMFNYRYNYDLIMERFPEAYAMFWQVQTIINSIAFPIGVALVAWFIWPVARAVRHGEVAAGTTPETRARLRHRSLRIGRFIALLAIIEWTVAGMAYPVAMYLGGIRLTMMDNAHFFSSLLLCGLVAAAYPFFFATAFVVRVIYPAFVEPFHMRASDVADMDRLERWTWAYLALGLLVPMLAVALMVTLGGPVHRLALAVISGSSIAGFVLLVGLARYIQNTLAIVRRMTGVADKRAT